MKTGDKITSTITANETAVTRPHRTFDEICKELAGKPCMADWKMRFMDCGAHYADFECDYLAPLLIYTNGEVWWARDDRRSCLDADQLSAIAAACNEIAANYEAEHGKEVEGGRMNTSNKTNNLVSIPLWDYWDTANTNTAEAALYRDENENVGYLHYNEDFVDSIAAALQCLTDAKTNYGNSFAPLNMEFEVEYGWRFEYPDNREPEYCYFKFRVLSEGDIWLVFFGSGKNGSVEYSVALPDLPTLRETLKNGHE